MTDPFSYFLIDNVLDLQAGYRKIKKIENLPIKDFNLKQRFTHAKMAAQLTYKKNAQGLYECQHCAVTYKNQNTMHYHLKKHEGMFPYKCKYCDKAFLQKQTMDQHITAKHADKADPHSCPCCKFQSTTVANLKIHFMRIHCKDICKFTMNKDNAIVTCGQCSSDFNSKTAYYYHTTQCIPVTKSHTHYSAYLKIMGSEA